AFRRELMEKIVELGARRRRRRGEAWSPVPAGYARAASRPAAPQPIALRPFSIISPRLLLIGASTGGPQALRALLAQLAGVCARIRVLIAQHMPPTFTTIMAEHLASASGRPAYEPRDGERVEPVTIYLAPGGQHMRVMRRDGVPVVTLDDGPMVNFCRPAVDPLFGSAARVWGAAALALVLTGMGTDGAEGAAAIVRAGGSVVAQDEASSVVWGMPGGRRARAFARRCCRSTASPRSSRSSSRGLHRDSGRLRVPARDAQGALRPRAFRLQAVSRGKPAVSRCAQGRSRRPCRPGAEIAQPARAAPCRTV